MGLSVVNEKEIANALADRLPPILAKLIADLDKLLTRDIEITIKIGKQKESA